MFKYVIIVKKRAKLLRTMYGGGTYVPWIAQGHRVL